MDIMELKEFVKKFKIILFKILLENLSEIIYLIFNNDFIFYYLLKDFIILVNINFIFKKIVIKNFINIFKIIN